MTEFHDDPADQAAASSTGTPLEQVEALVRAQLGAEAFEDLQVVLNPRYQEAVHPETVVPFQVRAFNQIGGIAGIAPTGRNIVFEGVALQNEDGWELYADSLSILIDLGVAIAFRPPFGTQGVSNQQTTTVLSTAKLGADQNI